MIKGTRPLKPHKRSALEAALYQQVLALKLTTGMTREYRFAAIACGGLGPGVRQRLKDAGLKDWRIDMAWVDKKLAVEVEGGIFTNGRHTRGTGFDEDAHKYNVLVLLGWRVLRFTTLSINSGIAAQTIEAALGQDWSQPWMALA